METLKTHVKNLVVLTSDHQRKAYLRRCPELYSDENVRLLCRQAVALLFSNVADSRNLCHVLTAIAQTRRTPLTSAYRDHAWGAAYYKGGVDYRRALARWKRAVTYFERAGRSDEAAITRLSALPTLACLDQLDLFAEWVNSARASFESTGDRLRLARLAANTASLHSQRSEWDLALAAYELAYKELIGGGAGSQDLYVALTSLAVCHIYLGDPHRAASFVTKARFACEDGGLSSASAELDAITAHVDYMRGDLASALRLARRASQYSVQNGLQRLSSDCAETEALILLSLGVLQDAERRAGDLLSGFANLGLKTGQAKALTILGLCATRRGRYDKALALHTRAKQLFEHGQNRESANQASLDQASCLFEAGKHVAADSIVRQLLDILDHNTSSPVRLSSYLLRSKILLERGELEEALNLAEAALARFSVLDRAPMEAEALYLFARIHELMGDPLMAYNGYLRCENCVARMRRQLTPGYLRTSFLSNKESLYEDIFSVALLIGMGSNRLFEHAERAKSRTLAELIAQDAKSPWEATRTVESAELGEAWASLRTSMNRIEDLRTSVGPHAAERIEELAARVTAAERATLRLIGNEANPQGNPVHADDIGATLPACTSLVEFYFARGTIFAFHVTDGSSELLRIGEADRAHRLQRLLQFQLRTRPFGTKGNAYGTSLLSYLKELYDLLWRPLLSQVDAPNLIIVPHSFLHQLPFHALFDGREFLIDRHAVTYSPSAQVFQATRSRHHRPPGKGSVVVGSSDPRAPMISSEVRTVSEMLSEPRILVDGQATKAHLLHNLRNASLIHIAAHGAFSPTDPSASAVGLDDGPLTVGELQELQLRAELVVLSGCETGRNVTKGTDDVLGLTQALLQAGARSAVVSLWNVDDESTASFMRLFYAQLRCKKDRANALRDAQLLHRKTHDHPFFWAPFVLVGDPTELPTPL